MKLQKRKLISVPRREMDSCRRILSGLGEKATAGSKLAAEELITFGILTTTWIERTHDAQEPLIREIAVQHPRFPMLYSWRKDENRARIAKTRALPLNEAIPFTTMGNRRIDEPFQAIVSLLYPRLEAMRHDLQPVRGLKKGDPRFKIRNLMPLSIASAPEWARAFADLHVGFDNNNPIEKNDVFYRLASPEREQRTRQQRARQRMNNNYPVAQLKKLDPVAATKRQSWDKRIKAMGVTRTSYRNRLAEALTRRLRRMLRRQAIN